jgi:hypothetical protein
MPSCVGCERFAETYESLKRHYGNSAACARKRDIERKKNSARKKHAARRQRNASNSNDNAETHQGCRSTIGIDSEELSSHSGIRLKKATRMDIRQCPGALPKVLC